MQHAGLYIHIPFCKKKCGYCDFYSVTTLKYRDEFVRGLVREIELTSPKYQELTFDTIYLGGGTPSLLSINDLSAIWGALHKHFKIACTGEFTIEANPATLDYSQLQDLRGLGFNRLSLGVQSFNRKDLEFLERIHTVKDVISSFEAARKAGFRNINVDLMSAFPGLTKRTFEHTLGEVVKLNPEHISCYTLIFEAGTPFYKKLQKGELKELENDREANFYKLAFDYLGEQGYFAYEISNFTKDEQWQCQHNLKYWDHQTYLGFGPSAHSFVAPKRWWNKKTLPAYLKELAQDSLPIENEEWLNQKTLEFEYIFLHLRLHNGFHIADFQKRFHNNFLQTYHGVFNKLVDNGMIRQMGERLMLTPRGWLFADEVASSF